MESGRAFMQRGIGGEVVMLNLLRFRKMADYSACPELAPPAPITGAQAFRKYIDHTLPFLKGISGRGNFLIGPQDERWGILGLTASSAGGGERFTPIIPLIQRD